MSAKNRIAFLIFLFTGSLAILSACKEPAPASGNTEAVRTPVTAIPVAFKPVTSTIELPATSVFMNKNIVRAKIAGTLESILVRKGDCARAGQLLATIRTREAAALVNLTGNDSTLAFKGLINITATESGVISSISYQKGDFVLEGDEIAVISDQNSLVFILDVPFNYQSIADKNRECSVLLPDGRTVSGSITGKLPEMDAQSQTIGYIIRPSVTNQLPANLIARVRLIVSSSSKALIVPREAVLGNETQTEFWVMKLIDDSTAVRVDILKGYENNDEIEITGPVFLESDRIVLKGNYGLSDTAGISITTEE